MNKKITNFSNIVNNYLDKICQLVDFTMSGSSVQEKEKVIISIFFNIYNNLNKNKFNGPEFFNIYKIATKVLLNTKILVKKIKITDIENTVSRQEIETLDLNKLFDSISYLSTESKIILYLINNNKFSQKELSIILNISVGTICSNLLKTKKIILNNYFKDKSQVSIPKEKDCFFIENFQSKYESSDLNKNKSLEITRHLQQCKSCRVFYENIEKINIGIRKHKANKYKNINEKIFNKIKNKFYINIFLQNILNNWITKFSLVSILVLFTFSKIKFPSIDFSQTPKELKIASKYLKKETTKQIIKEKIENDDKKTIDNTTLDSINKEDDLIQKSKNTPKTPKNILNAEFVYKLIISSNKWSAIDSELASIIKKYAGIQAGSIPLGTEKNEGTYYHMYISTKNLEAFLVEVNSIAGFNVLKEKETRDIPQDSTRIVIWVGRTE